MKKTLIGAAAAALVTVAAAAPAQAQYRYDRHDRRGGIDTEDVITGIAVLGGVAAILSALDRDGGRYGYDSRYRYRDNYSAAVNACGYEAERISGGGNVRITDVDRSGRDRYRVRGVVEARYDRYNRYARYDRRYDSRYDRYDRYDRRFGGRDGRDDFTCYALGNGRITDFNL